MQRRTDLHRIVNAKAKVDPREAARRAIEIERRTTMMNGARENLPKVGSITGVRAGLRAKGIIRNKQIVSPKKFMEENKMTLDTFNQLTVALELTLMEREERGRPVGDQFGVVEAMRGRSVEGKTINVPENTLHRFVAWALQFRKRK